jgi:hypothetical protein
VAVDAEGPLSTPTPIWSTRPLVDDYNTIVRAFTGSSEVWHTDLPCNRFADSVAITADAYSHPLEEGPGGRRAGDEPRPADPRRRVADWRAPLELPIILR